MASTLTQLLYHGIWSTKDRAPLITRAIEENVWKILASVATHNEIHVIRAGGIDDHVHVLMRIPKTMSVADAMRRIKGGSAKYINEERLCQGRFGWQDGYGAFSVSASSVPAVTAYIASQRDHHRMRGFQDEFLDFLEKHGVEYDERYVWG
ncbi:IS200/IS605 family transposase [Haloferula sp. A504]|uniref:IS200/IS605 family transposase n=1 Tax=Haloferula sp. A504 TaxID=3373601 RepID=UPI0031C699C1|nr:IS200/IS605 family transposase [Verrucomicrobiaceae bacterium E54]